MNFSDLQKAQSIMKNTELKKQNRRNGTSVTVDYAKVEERIKGFRYICPSGCIETNSSITDTMFCVVKAAVYDEEHKLLATGTASGNLSEDKTVELIETAAIGRALKFCGIGLDLNFENKFKNEEVTYAENKMKILQYVKRHKYSESDIKIICDKFGVKSLEDMNAEQCRYYIEFIAKKGGNINE